MSFLKEEGGGGRTFLLIAQNLIKYNVKSGCTFHLSLIGIHSILILSVKNRGVGFFLLNGPRIKCFVSLNLFPLMT